MGAQRHSLTLACSAPLLDANLLGARACAQVRHARSSVESQLARVLSLSRAGYDHVHGSASPRRARAKAAPREAPGAPICAATSFFRSPIVSSSLREARQAARAQFREDGTQLGAGRMRPASPRNARARRTQRGSALATHLHLTRIFLPCARCAPRGWVRERAQGRRRFACAPPAIRTRRSFRTTSIIATAARKAAPRHRRRRKRWRSGRHVPRRAASAHYCLDPRALTRGQGPRGSPPPRLARPFRAFMALSGAAPRRSLRTLLRFCASARGGGAAAAPGGEACAPLGSLHALARATSCDTRSDVALVRRVVATAARAAAVAHSGAEPVRGCVPVPHNPAGRRRRPPLGRRCAVPTAGAAFAALPPPARVASRRGRAAMGTARGATRHRLTRGAAAAAARTATALPPAVLTAATSQASNRRCRRRRRTTRWLVRLPAPRSSPVACF